MPKIVSQPLAPPELLNYLACFCEDLFRVDCVCATNEKPCTQTCNAGADRTSENIFTALSIITTENIIE